MADRLARVWDRTRGGIPGGYWVLIMGIFLFQYAYWHHYARMWDGDSLYYLAMALKFAGHSTDDAIRLTGIFFHQQATIGRIRGGLTGQHGLPGASMYYMIEPRFVLPLASAPFIALFGTSGIWVVPFLCSIAFVYALMRLVSRLFSPEIALLVTGAYLLTEAFFFFQSGILTEGPATLCVVLLLLNLPLGRTVTWKNDVIVVFLLVLLTFTRQAGPVPVAAIFFAWLWTAVRLRSWRNEWTGITVVSLVACFLLQVLTMVLFPYNALRNFSEVNHLGSTSYAEHHLWQTVSKFPHIAWNLLQEDLRDYFVSDNAMRVLWVLALVGLVLRVRTIYGAMFLGALIPSVVLWFLNSTMSEFRYYLPMYPMLLLLVAEFVRWVVATARDRMKAGADVPAPASSPESAAASGGGAAGAAVDVTV